MRSREKTKRGCRMFGNTRTRKDRGSGEKKGGEWWRVTKEDDLRRTGILGRAACFVVTSPHKSFPCLVSPSSSVDGCVDLALFEFGGILPVVLRWLVPMFSLETWIAASVTRKRWVQRKRTWCKHVARHSGSSWTDTRNLLEFA